MTTYLPVQNILDRFLYLLGKKRGLYLSRASYQHFGHFTSIVAVKESFWKALFRPRKKPLPDYLSDINSKHL